jgi:hypothetical protein
MTLQLSITCNRAAWRLPKLVSKLHRMSKPHRMSNLLSQRQTPSILPLLKQSRRAARLLHQQQQHHMLGAAPVLKTPAKRNTTARVSEAPTVRRNGRLAEKTQAKGKKTAEELAQDLLCRKLEGSQPDFTAQARDRLTKLFDAPIPQNAMEAIEELLKFISLEGKGGAPATKSGKKALKA